MQDEAKRGLNFSPEEWAIIVGFLSPRQGVGSRIGWYASILAPIVVLCGYGAWKGEITAVGLAFLCLLGCVLWAIATEIKSVDLYRSIGSKIVEFKHSRDE